LNDAGDKLTAPERELLARARQLARVDAALDLRMYLRQRGHDLGGFGLRDKGTPEYVFMTGFYDAGQLLGELADLVERLTGG
jgi:hypothetical protein